ncbi:MAG TPA: DUF262 domain-containing protein [Parafilimonas sp.]|nr:DUF262 domain-containing protein [Parafilimonas sp.]
MKILKDKKPLDKLYMRRDRYDLQPDFQREKVWNEEDEQKLLDTILRKWDIPKVYLNVLGEDNFEVIDGQQRLTAIFRFYDNNISLSDDYNKQYGGLYYADLPDKIKDVFDDYELDLVLVENAADEELRELFARLQLGKPLNTGEKLNAIHGEMRNFAKNLTEHKFFDKKIQLKNTRFTYLSIASQLCILAVKGIENHKFKDIEDFLNSHVNFNARSEHGKKIKKILDLLAKIFPDENQIFRNRASITTIFTIVDDLIKNGYDFTKEEKRNRLKDFYEDFDEKLKSEVEKGAAAKDPELIVYQSKVTQGADNKTSISLRRSILKRKLVEYDSSFKEFVEVTPAEIDLLDYRKKETIKEISDSCLMIITEINKIFKPKKGGDLFKMTTDVISGSMIIAKPVETRQDFKEFMDALYKIVYEGSGSLARIPADLKDDNAIYFDIKHIRTDCFHDVEHGEETKIKKKQEVISDIYKKYTEKKSLQEIDSPDLIKFQRKFLKNLNSELQLLKEKLIVTE